jgi:hypothetical protein
VEHASGASEETDAEESPEDGDEDPDDMEVADTRAEPDAAAEMPGPCLEEQRVAERALKMRRDGDTLDHLLRIDTIVFQSEDARRARLELVATQWYEREGRDPDASALRAEVLRDCRKALAAAERGRAEPASAEAASPEEISPAP